LADGAVINLGADQDTTLTHVADTGILLNSSRQFQFGDSGTYVYQSTDGTINIIGDTLAEITAPNIRLEFDDAAYLNIATSDGAGTVNSQISDGTDSGANDGSYDGLVRTYTVDSGATSVFGQALHVDTDGELIVADGDVASQGAMPAIGLAVEAGTGSKKVLLQGTICETDWAWTVGGIVYVSDDPTTTEGLTQTAISTTGDTVQVVGVATTADCIEVNMGGYVLVEVP
jgi:hypothetical protein